MAKGANIAERVEDLIAPSVSALGYRIWDVEYVKEGAEWYLRIFIDIHDFPSFVICYTCNITVVFFHVNSFFMNCFFYRSGV